MAPHDTPQLLPRETKALRALIEEPTVGAAAKAAGIGRKTIYRYLKREAFQRAYTEARRTALHTSLARLQVASSDAVQALSQVVRDPSSKPSDRVSAARTILEQGCRAAEFLDLEERLAALEARAGKDAPPQ